MKFRNIFTLFLITCILLFGFACKALKPKKVDLRKQPIDARERAIQNVKEGRGIGLGDIVGGSRGTNYEFSTSNPLWRASLETIDFIPLTTVDYSGGIIISDWYNDGNSNDSLKITVRFLSNTVAAESLKIIIHKKECKPSESCSMKLVQSRINEEISKGILRRAAVLEEEQKNKKK